MTHLFVDCEFNGTMGGLISMGIVTEAGDRTFYEVVDLTEPVDPWVKDNVMPILEKEPIPYAAFQKRLHGFLGQFGKVHIIADHPEDIIRVNRALIISGGTFAKIQPITFEIIEELSAKASKVPHNAFHDAVALRDSWLKLNGFI